MYAILLPLGVISAVAGLVLIGFGVPIKEFTLGNTLIIAGTTAFTGGLVVVGLAAAVRQLNRIANALASRPPVRGAGRAPEAEAPPPVPVAARATPAPRTRPPAPPPPKPPEVQVPEPPAYIPPPTPTFIPPEEPPATPRPRPNVFAINRGPPESSPPAEPDLPMPQVVTQRPPVAPRPVSADVATEPKFSPTEAPAWVSNGGGTTPPPLSAPPDMRPPAESRPAERPPRTSPFDAVWPARSRPAKTATADAPRTPDTEPPAPAPAAEPREQAPYDGKRELARAGADTRQVTILKSGVIDGMAYTLYTDGSIEAQLPQGTMRFASIEELRVYLEQNP